MREPVTRYEVVLKGLDKGQLVVEVRHGRGRKQEIRKEFSGGNDLTSLLWKASDYIRMRHED